VPAAYGYAAAPHAVVPAAGVSYYAPQPVAHAQHGAAAAWGYAAAPYGAGPPS